MQTSGQIHPPVVSVWQKNSLCPLRMRLGQTKAPPGRIKQQ